MAGGLIVASSDDDLPLLMLHSVDIRPPLSPFGRRQGSPT
jgi:hypothetical protein